ncbi:hypothetical protein [Metallibacterium sp.]|uniref:hypothetical protein n=1 Tax=Metallibacterium sp. TaxID=2940281 RepID=UPI002614B474|nr:hypothetical protein [Metallibacterium sp.]
MNLELMFDRTVMPLASRQAVARLAHHAGASVEGWRDLSAERLGDGSSLVLKAEPWVTGDKIKMMTAIDASIKVKPHMSLSCYTEQRRQVQVGRLQNA